MVRAFCLLVYILVTDCAKCLSVQQSHTHSVHASSYWLHTLSELRVILYYWTGPID